MCGAAAKGFCDNPDPGHTGPCTWNHRTPAQAAAQIARNKLKKQKQKEKRKNRPAGGKDE